MIAVLFTYMERIIIENNSSAVFSRFAGWLFTIGFLKLAFWQGVLALILWPYYIGMYASSIAGA